MDSEERNRQRTAVIPKAQATAPWWAVKVTQVGRIDVSLHCWVALQETKF